MLGENHSLKSEFPEFIERIEELASTDPEFRKKLEAYDTLEEEIRALELQNSPIDDDSMHQNKHTRSVLKDELYHRLAHAE